MGTWRCGSDEACSSTDFALVRRLPKIAGIIIISILVTIFAIDMVVTLKNLIGIRKSFGTA